MFHEIVYPLLDLIFGLSRDSTDLTVWQVCARGITIYLLGLTLIRLGKNRFVGRNTVFDLLLVLILGSALSRSINGSAPFEETIVLAALLVFMHALFAMGAFHDGSLGGFIKGETKPLVEDGLVDDEAMRSAYVTTHDLEEAMRQNSLPPVVDRVKSAHLERDGRISVVPKAGIYEVKVEEGVQTVRIVVE